MLCRKTFTKRSENPFKKADKIKGFWGLEGELHVVRIVVWESACLSAGYVLVFLTRDGQASQYYDLLPYDVSLRLGGVQLHASLLYNHCFTHGQLI